MEVAGTAVGIASLGIQVCQSLLSYYADWQEYNANISNTYKVIVDLGKQTWAQYDNYCNILQSHNIL